MGNSGHKKDPSKRSTRQVTTESSDNHSGASEGNCVDPLSLLYSDSDSTVDTVSDKGTKPQYVNVQVQAVLTSGVMDMGADITIMGGKLFKQVAAGCMTKKRDFKKPD